MSDGFVDGRLFRCCDNAGRHVLFELQTDWLKGQAAVVSDAEDLDDLVVTAGCQERAAVQCTEFCSICKIGIIHQSRDFILLILQNVE